jgi:hypothetical protein
VVAIDEVIDQKLDAIHELESQLYEGGALGSEEEFRLVPKEPEARKAWFKKEHYWARRDADVANQAREALVTFYGSEKGKAVKYAESFEICEYGRRIAVPNRTSNAANPHFPGESHVALAGSIPGGCGVARCFARGTRRR